MATFGATSGAIGPRVAQDPSGSLRIVLRGKFRSAGCRKDLELILGRNFVQILVRLLGGGRGARNEAGGRREKRREERGEMR